MIYQIESQLSVHLENETGAIARVSSLLEKKGISMNAVSLNGESKSGQFRFISSEAEQAAKALKAAGYQVSLDEVLSIRMKDSKGRLASLTNAFSSAGIDIDYVYATVDEEGAGSRLILKVSNVHLASRVIDELQVAA